MPDINVILSTMTMIGSNLPAYRQLLDQIIGLFHEQDQAKLKAGYEAALADAKAAHEAAQAL